MRKRMRHRFAPRAAKLDTHAVVLLAKWDGLSHPLNVSDAADYLVSQGVAPFIGFWAAIRTAVKRVCIAAEKRIAAREGRSWASINRARLETVQAMQADDPAERLVLRELVERKSLQREKRAKQKRTQANAQPIAAAEVPGIYNGSDQGRTKRLYKSLDGLGSHGAVVAQLLRCQKSSSRAKNYRGAYKDLAYDRKGKTLRKLCTLLKDSGLVWGWGRDEHGYLEDVLYVELPVGQISFHSTARFEGPDYHREWDGEHSSESRIVEYATRILSRRSDDPIVHKLS